jgi:hypothetical protein
VGGEGRRGGVQGDGGGQVNRKTLGLGAVVWIGHRAPDGRTPMLVEQCSIIGVLRDRAGNVSYRLAFGGVRAFSDVFATRKAALAWLEAGK